MIHPQETAQMWRSRDPSMRDCGCSSHNGLLTAKGLAEAAQREDVAGAVLAGPLAVLQLDRVRSVSGLPPDEIHWPPDALIDQQYRRFHNGS